MTKHRIKVELFWLLCLTLVLGALQSCANHVKVDVSKPDALASSHIQSLDGAIINKPMKLSFPCSDAGGAEYTDPNNCGACGVVCGTWAPQGQKGFSFQGMRCYRPGSKPWGNCGEAGAGMYPAPVVATPAADCYDNAPPGSVVDTRSIDGSNGGSLLPVPPDAALPCVNIMTDPQNCGALGKHCPTGLFCQFGNCL